MAKKNLTQQVAELTAGQQRSQAEIAELHAALAAAQAAADDAAAHAAAIEAEAAAVVAQAQAAAVAEVEAANAAAAQAALEAAQMPPPPLPQAPVSNPAPAPPDPELPIVPQPHGTFNIRAAMGIPLADYQTILRTVRGLTVCARLDWTEDFRRQDPDKLSMVFRAAREQHPILARYQNNWATSAIARQYMANRRKHAVKSGYIAKRQDRHGNGRGPGPHQGGSSAGSSTSTT